MFCVGSNLFREGFYFCQGNNVSRKDFYKGSLLTTAFLSIVMASISTVFNIIVNIFVTMPGFYDIEFQGVNANPIISYILLVIVFALTFQIGFLIGEIYFRLQKRGQIIASILIGLLFIFWGNADKISFINRIFHPIVEFFNNVYTVSLGMFVTLAVACAVSSFLIKGAEVNK